MFKKSKHNSKFLIQFGAVIFSVIAFCLCFLNFQNTNNVFAEDNVQTIDSLSAITNLSGNYALKKDQVYTYSSSLGTFTGSLNGNGAKIVFEGTNCVPLFESIGTNAVVKNLVFDSQNENVIEYVFDVTSNNSCGLLARTIAYADVCGVEFNNISLALNDNPTNTAVSTLNVGLLAGQVKGAKIHQIKINNCKVVPYMALTETISLRPNMNFGLLVGSAIEGSKLQNNLINNNNVKISIGESLSENFNVGTIAGVLESGFISNNIVSFGSENSFVVEFDRTNKFLNFGYLLGNCKTNMSSIINNIVNVKEDTMLSLSEENIFAGIIIGQIPNTLASDNLNGFVTTFSANYVGSMANSTFEAKYSNIKNIQEDTYINNNIKNSENWNDTYVWNFNTIWRETTSNLPTLQIFEEYVVSFSSQESVKSLGIENLPTLASGDVVVSTLTADKIAYGSTLTISASITTENNFDKFFYITGLRLNGNEIYNIQTQKSAEGYNVSSTITNDNISFDVHNINANNSGVYSVQLARTSYKMKIKVYELTVDETAFIPGKVKNNMASDAKQEIVVDMKYGEKFTYETYDVNSDYAKEADWYLTYISQNQEENPSEDDSTIFNLEEELSKTNNADKLACFTSKRSLSWTFNEKSTLFGYDKLEGDESNYLDINQYNYDETNPDSKMFVAYVVFTRDVKDIEIRFKFDDDDEITEKIAEVLIDDGAVSVTYKNGVFTTKIRYGTKPHTITLRNLSTEYTFDGWYINSRMPAVEGDEYAGSFEVQNDGETNTIVLNAVFTKADKTNTTNLLWLWISLGGVVLVGIVVTIIIVKKKKSGGSSYKKYMY